MNDLRVLFANDAYYVSFEGRTYKYDNYMTAKSKIDSIMQSIYFHNQPTKKEA